MWKWGLQEPTSPNLATFEVNHLRDIPIALRELERQTYPLFLLYPVNLASAPYSEIEIEEYNRHMQRASWDQEEAILMRRVEQTLYDLLSNAFRNFAPAQYTFNRHRRDHPLCLSRVWFSLLDTINPQVDEQGLWTTGRYRCHPGICTCATQPPFFFDSGTQGSIYYLVAPRCRPAKHGWHPEKN